MCDGSTNRAVSAASKGVVRVSGTGRRPTWAEFDARPTWEFEQQSPAAELAALLERFRTELDECGRVAAESRAQGLRALAEQAVLAVELEKLLERGSRVPGRRDDELRRVKDRMLANIEVSGLEIVRLRGADLVDVADIVDVDCWRYLHLAAGSVVIDELEAAVRVDGRTVRRGRVIVGGQQEDFDRHPPPRSRERPAASPADNAAMTPPDDRPPKAGIRCPIASCHAENHPSAELCVGCLTPLAGYGRLSVFPDVLFNRGLGAARRGDMTRARECFAAVVVWCPSDITTRNAYALACLDEGDTAAARRGWRSVLAYRPGDSIAARGLAFACEGADKEQ